MLARFGCIIAWVRAANVASGRAIEAQRFESLFRRSRELEPSLRGQLPLILVITSAGDLATKVAFPLGRWFATLFNSYRPAQAPTGSSGLMLDEAAADRT